MMMMMMVMMMMTLLTISLLDLSYRQILKIKSHTEPVPMLRWVGILCE